jgi:hypothetical protein
MTIDEMHTQRKLTLLCEYTPNNHEDQMGKTNRAFEIFPFLSLFSKEKKEKN